MRNRLTSLAVLWTAVIAGCAVAPQLTPPSGDVHDDRLARREQTIEDFDSRRSAAQLAAARERFGQGDIAACRSQLEQLLRGDPRHVEARRLLADVYLIEQQPLAAAEQLQQLLEVDSSDHLAHHSLGLLMMNSAHNDEALAHLQLAAELAPDSELYRASLAALEASQTTGAAGTSSASEPGTSVPG